MKTAYKQWNRNHYINDESVLEDIKIITKGELSISDDASFDYLKKCQEIKLHTLRIDVISLLEIVVIVIIKRIKANNTKRENQHIKKIFNIFEALEKAPFLLFS